MSRLYEQQEERESKASDAEAGISSFDLDDFLTTDLKNKGKAVTEI